MTARIPHPEALSVGALLTVLIALGQISTGIIIPSLPALGRDLGTDPAAVNLIFTLFLAGFAVAQLAYGPLSDRFGRRRMLFWGMAIYVAASAACAVAPTIETLIVARIVQSFGACAGPVLGRAIVRDVYGPERSAKAMAYIGVAFSLSPAVIPALGGFLQVWFGWRAPFLFLLGVGAAVAVAAWALLPETNRRPDPRALDPVALAGNVAVLLRHRGYVAHTAAVSLTFMGLMGFMAAAPFLFIERLGLSPDRFGLMPLISALGFLFGNLAAGRLATRVGAERLVTVGLGLGLAGGGGVAGLGLLGHTGVAETLVPFLAFATGLGVVMPAGMAGAMAPFPRIAGSASALLGFFQMVGGAAGAGLSGHLVHATQTPVGLILAGVSATGLVVFLSLSRRG